MMALTIEQVLALRSDIEATDLADIKAQAEALLPLAAIRERAGVTQSEIAMRLGKSQAAVSKFEGRSDFLLSTLYRHVSAIGADLRIGITVGGSRYQLVPTLIDEDVAFSIAKCSAKDASAFLVEHARQYSSIPTQTRNQLKRWARPQRRTSDDKLLSAALGD